MSDDHDPELLNRFGTAFNNKLSRLINETMREEFNTSQGTPMMNQTEVITVALAVLLAAHRDACEVLNSLLIEHDHKQELLQDLSQSACDFANEHAWTDVAEAPTGVTLQ